MKETPCIGYPFVCPEEGFPFLGQFRFPAGFVLRQHFLCEIISEQTHIGQRSLNTFQHPLIKRDFPDVMDLAGTRITFIVAVKISLYNTVHFSDEITGAFVNFTENL